MAFGIGSSIKKKAKKAEKSFKKHVSTIHEGSILTGGLPGGGLAKVERSLGSKIGGQRGRRFASKLQKRTIGTGMDTQLGVDTQKAEDYFNPKVPELSPDPQIAAEAKLEAARRRSRDFGRNMLMTSRKRSQSLGA